MIWRPVACAGYCLTASRSSANVNVFGLDAGACTFLTAAVRKYRVQILKVTRALPPVV